jgi:acyl-CoA synthetase (AMP-forming)/AMP-acid ligase II
LRIAVKQDRLSLYYFIEKAATERGDEDCVWSRARCYNWNEGLTLVHQYSQLFLSQGVQPGDLVALFMRNSPDFVFAWIGLWAVGAAPALINTSLTGNALLHCLGISQARLILADGGPDVLSRINGVAAELEASGVRILKLDEIRDLVYGLDPVRPGDELRAGVRPGSPMCLLYTR